MITLNERPLTPFFILGDTYFVTGVYISDRGSVDLHLVKFNDLTHDEQEEVSRRERISTVSGQAVPNVNPSTPIKSQHSNVH